MRPEYAVLFLAVIVLTYARSYEDVREEIKNEIEKDIIEYLAEDAGEFDDKAIEVNRAKKFRFRICTTGKLPCRWAGKKY
uniref:Arminin 11167 n=1 Tax=Hydra viridissima TaxID=6082 RepID=R9UCY0_HYDVD|nr:arminin 11167 [Hydra viridissima]